MIEYPGNCHEITVQITDFILLIFISVNDSSHATIVNGNAPKNDHIPSLLGDMESLSMDPKSFTNIVQPTLVCGTYT